MQGQYDPSKDHIVTAASCTTNCLAPVVKVIHENLKVVKGAITTVHCVTNTQTIIDAPNAKKADLRRARSGLMNLAPTSTGSATAIALIFPDLKGKLNGAPHRAVSIAIEAWHPAGNPWAALHDPVAPSAHGQMQAKCSVSIAPSHAALCAAHRLATAAVCLQGTRFGCRSPTPASRTAFLKWSTAQQRRR